MANRYRVDTARDDVQNLKEVLEHLATLPGHVGIISVTWQGPRPSREGNTLHAGYTIVSEQDAG